MKITMFLRRLGLLVRSWLHLCAPSKAMRLIGDSSPAPKGVVSLPPWSFTSEIFLDASLGYAQSAHQGNFCKVVAVETGDVLLVGARYALLRLHHFHAYR